MSKKVVIDQEVCIGCNTCPLIAPKVFKMDPSNYKAVVINQPQKIDDQVETAVSSCPVNAITIIEEK